MQAKRKDSQPRVAQTIHPEFFKYLGFCFAKSSPLVRESSSSCGWSKLQRRVGRTCCGSSPTWTGPFAGALPKDTLQPLALLVPLLLLPHLLLLILLPFLLLLLHLLQSPWLVAPKSGDCAPTTAPQRLRGHYDYRVRTSIYMEKVQKATRQIFVDKNVFDFILHCKSAKVFWMWEILEKNDVMGSPWWSGDNTIGLSPFKVGSSTASMIYLNRIVLWSRKSLGNICVLFI